ncbi:MAG: S8 family serine peptidase [Acidobacteriota bacterium]
MELSPRLVDGLVYGFGRLFRLTQDSPVLPEVWSFFATPSLREEERLRSRHSVHPDVERLRGRDRERGTLDLLLTPHRLAGPATLAAELRSRLRARRQLKAGGAEDGPKNVDIISSRVAYTQSFVVASLDFEEMVQVLLPLTPWWRTFVWGDALPERAEDSDVEGPPEPNTLERLLFKAERADLGRQVERWARQQLPESYSRGSLQAFVNARSASDGDERQLPADLLWMVNIIGTLSWAREMTPDRARQEGLRIDESGRLDALPARPEVPGADETAAEAVDAPLSVDYDLIVNAACVLLKSSLPGTEATDPSLWLINRNRPATQAVSDSRQTVKADAAIQLFDIKCQRLAWAVLDSGIDASHPAFLKDRREDDADADGWAERTRVVKTYDFTRLRPLLDQDVVRKLLRARNVAGLDFKDADLNQQLAPIRELLAKEDEALADTKRKDPARRLRRQLSDLARRIEKGREIDWELLDPLLQVSHDGDYPVPISDHGTHVAGILGADWRREDEDAELPKHKRRHNMLGVCPDIRLYDMRVLDPFGPNDEFTVLAALQFIQYLNLQKELLTIHGANLSLSIRHDVKNYACGRTPVCEECERLVASGVVVVAASGNAGWDEQEAQSTVGAGYRAMSITDPGNADAVITVGATHRMSPHTYGVSFFSSRGPTGDGRSKPDLVAPGEKITSTTPGGRSERLDGTSMAAPHVSGAAALLMARHLELMGRPRRIKEILCETATDLGREKHFQGAGMLDALRALQSV